jgi:hypothetical protein
MRWRIITSWTLIAISIGWAIYRHVNPEVPNEMKDRAFWVLMLANGINLLWQSIIFIRWRRVLHIKDKETQGSP